MSSQVSENSVYELLAAIGRIPGALRRGVAERRHRKRMRRAQVYAVRDLPENTFGKLVGWVRPLGSRVLEAPLSGRLCIYYDVSIDAMVEGSMVRVLASEQDGIPFLLEDETGRAVIDPAHASMSVEVDAMSMSRPNDAGERERELLVRTGALGRRMLFGDSLRYRESILGIDTLVAVYGGGVREPDPDAVAAGYRDGTPTRIHLMGTARFPLFISDDPRAL